MFKKCLIGSLLVVTSLSGKSHDNHPSNSKTASPKEVKAKTPYLKLTDDLQRFAKKFIGIRYLSGGKATKGFDCSGFVNYVFAKFGMKVAHRSTDLFKLGYNLSPKEAMAGDLIFFRINPSANKDVSHVGIVVGSDKKGLKFIHSATSKGVSFSYLNEKYYTTHFAGIRRVIDSLKDF